MRTPNARSVPADELTLTPENILGDFNAHAALTRQGVRILHEALGVEGLEALDCWKRYFGKWAGRTLDKLPRHLARLADRYGVSTGSDGAEKMLFAMQTYYALLVKLLAERFGPAGVVDAMPDCPFRWCGSAKSAAVNDLVVRMQDAMARYRIASSCSESEGDCDLFKPLYQNLFPRPLRRQLGEYYTPDWLANHVLDQVGYDGDPGQRLLDPACGSGTFMLLALRRWKRRGERRGERGEGNDECRMMNDEVKAASETIHHSSFIIHHFPIVGFDINPLAVMTARANYLIAVADILPQSGRVEIPVYLCDSIRGNAIEWNDGESFDFIAGNPPWIAWDNLPEGRTPGDQVLVGALWFVLAFRQ